MYLINGCYLSIELYKHSRGIYEMSNCAIATVRHCFQFDSINFSPKFDDPKLISVKELVHNYKCSTIDGHLDLTINRCIGHLSSKLYLVASMNSLS